jgi:hypothetical protein
MIWGLAFSIKKGVEEGKKGVTGPFLWYTRLERWNRLRNSERETPCSKKYTYVLVENLSLILCCDERHGGWRW